MPANDKRFVAHIDILGMSTLVEQDAEAAWNLLSGLVECLETVNGYELEFKDAGARLNVPEKVGSVMFSDTIVLFTIDDSDLSLRSLIVAVGALFHRALVKCVPVRAALAYGTFFINQPKSMYAGPALIEAYRHGESAQWLGIVACPSVVGRAAALGMTSDSKNIIVPWSIPVKTGTIEGYAVNWPAAVQNDMTVPAPLTAEQFYEAFHSTFGDFNLQPPDVKAKYKHTVDFMNAMLSDESA
jgi:hypothetical protein